MAMSVLLVEDEALISMLVSDWLVELGFDVHEARTADEALDYIGAGGAVDVLFTDINLPGSMTGAELARKARALLPELPVLPPAFEPVPPWPPPPCPFQPLWPVWPDVVPEEDEEPPLFPWV